MSLVRRPKSKVTPGAKTTPAKSGRQGRIEELTAKGQTKQRVPGNAPAEKRTAQAQPVEPQPTIQSMSNITEQEIVQRRTRLKNVTKGFIAGLQFKIQSAESIRGEGRCNVTQPDFVTPKAGCVVDQQMGPTSRNNTCSKCQLGIDKCSGHAGYIELAVPIFNPAYIKQITRLMTCFSYSEYLQSHKERTTYIHERMGEFEEFINGTPLPAKNSMRALYKDQKGIVSKPGMNINEFALYKAELKKDAEKRYEAEAPKVQIRPMFNILTVRTEALINAAGPDRLNLVFKSAKDKQDPNSTVLVTYTVEKHVNTRHKINMVSKSKDKKEEPLVIPQNPMIIRDFLVAIDDDVDEHNENRNWAELVGLGDNKLQHMVMTVFPVLPNTIRPMNIVGDNTIHSKLTEQYSHIVTANNLLKSYLGNKPIRNAFDEVESYQKDKATEYTDKSGRGTTETSPPDIYKSLNSLIFNLFYAADDSYDENMGFASSDKRISFKTLMNGKKGIVRDESLGKRADYGGRTVVIGDPLIDVDEVGLSQDYLVPKNGKIITIPEVVTDDNIDQIRDMLPQYDEDGNLIREGVVVRVHVTTARGILKKDFKAGEDITIKVGDIVKRKLMNGDPIILSRQPVLHKGSLMGFQLRIIPDAGSVIRINPAVTVPFNADFDGDEMNLAIPQNIYTRQEVRRIMMVTNCIRGDGASKPWIALIQNAVVGVERMTQPEVKIKVGICNNIIMTGLEVVQSAKRTPEARANFHSDIVAFRNKMKSMGVNPFSGRGCISFFFPKGFVYERRAKKGAGGESVIVSDGVMLSGVLDAQDLGRSSNGIVDSILEQYGAETTIIYLSAIQQVVNAWLENTGFSVGWSDCRIANNDSAQFNPQRNIDRLIEKASVEVIKIFETEAKSDIDKQQQERTARAIISRARDEVTRLIKTGGIDVRSNVTQIKAEKNNEALREILELVKNDTLLEAIFGERDVKKVTPEVWSEEANMFKNVGQQLTERLRNETPVRTSKQFFTRGKKLHEQQIEILDQAVRLRQEIIFALRFDNSFLQLVRSGAKGSITNVASVMGLLGQQEREGERLPLMFTDNTRTLPFFERNTQDPVSRGFCTSSYTQGLTPAEFFIHAMASRANIVEAALKPSTTGYFFRKAYSIMEDLVSYEDGSVRDESGRVVQFAYGGDFFDVRKVTSISGTPQFINAKQVVKALRVAMGKSEFAVEFKK
jgi:DNA-directed RNA polymerase beta' subunit